MSKGKGGFTLPGEAGYEKLTLQLAEKWGADVIRDSDGTELSEEITKAGYGIYSTICIIREHNAWAEKNKDKLQQTFLCTPAALAVPAVNTAGEKACEEGLSIHLTESFFEEQFAVNDSQSALRYWQVYDRTTNTLLDQDAWIYEKEQQCVTIKKAVPWHRYTVSFLAYRIWEEISMYNHTTNHWEKEHLIPIEPHYPETQEYLLSWLHDWCREHADTTAVRFTSLFYNFVWIWGSSEKNRHLFTDWGSYDFTVSVPALDAFADRYGYSLTAEDFINQGKRHATHMPGDAHKKDWMEYTNDFVLTFGKKLVELVHSYGKKAYVFYDDSWVGIEPYNGRFQEFGFDGLIKCVFSGFEARLCAGVEVPVHELRLHPYLFPVGLGGAPTFGKGGQPTLEAKKFWINVRRALLREPVERIGLGGYLHLVEDYPDFVDFIEQVSDEFRLIQSFHAAGKPYSIRTRVAVLHSWGKLRSWTLSGHFHETLQHDLIHINEALSGLPVDVVFLSFEDIRKGALKDVDVVINAGYAGSAWSGGDVWKDGEIVTLLTQWAYEGGCFLGVNEPSAVEGYDTFFRMAHVLGIDKDTGARVCHGRWMFTAEDPEGILPGGVTVKGKEQLYLTDPRARVLLAGEDQPLVTVNEFGKGKGIYLAGFEWNLMNARMLLQLIRYAGGEGGKGIYLTDNPFTECAYYPEGKMLVIINNSVEQQTTCVETEEGTKQAVLEAYGTLFMQL